MAGKPSRMDGYIRVSRKLGRSGPGYISPSVQREAIRRWADYRSVEIVEWHVDEDQSGGTQNRPGLVAAMERIEAGETDGLACWRLNRFARNVDGAIRDVKRIQAAGGHLALVEEDVDPTGPFGTFILTILLAVATLERDNMVAGFIEAKRRAVERGAYVSRTPFGYARNPDGTLTPDGHAAPIVAEAFRLAAGDSLHAAMEYLRERAPSRRWRMHQVRRLIAGHSYLGELRNGDEVNLSSHEPLVSRAIWEAAQSTPLRRRSAETFPLSGLLACTTCGRPMVGGRGGTGQRVYRCSGTMSRVQVPEDRCPQGVVITADHAERAVRDRARRLARMTVTVSDPDVDQLTLAERAVLEAEAELDAFAADLTMRRALGDRYHTHLQTRLDAVERARGAYRERARAAQEQLTIRADEILDGEDHQLLSALLRSIFDRIEVRPGRGLKAADRIRFLPFDADGPAGEPGAQQRK